MQSENCVPIGVVAETFFENKRKGDGKIAALTVKRIPQDPRWRSVGPVSRPDLFSRCKANYTDPMGLDVYLIVYGQAGSKPEMQGKFEAAARHRASLLKKGDELMEGDPVPVNNGQEFVALLRKAHASGKKLDHIIIYAHGHGTGILFNQEGPQNAQDPQYKAMSLYVNRFRFTRNWDKGAAFVNELDPYSVNPGAEVEIYSCGPFRNPELPCYNPATDPDPDYGFSGTIGFEIEQQLRVKVKGATCAVGYPRSGGVVVPTAEEPEKGGRFITVSPPERTRKMHLAPEID